MDENIKYVHRYFWVGSALSSQSRESVKRIYELFWFDHQLQHLVLKHTLCQVIQLDIFATHYQRNPLQA